MASQIRTVALVSNSKKKGKENMSENTAPNMYTGRRPHRSESAPKAGVVKRPTAAAMITPNKAVLRGNPSSLVT